jgi:hypothetical protein
LDLGRLGLSGSAVRRLLPECNGFGLGCENGLRDSGGFFYWRESPLILCAMTRIRRMLAHRPWGLARARVIAAEIGGSARELKALVGVLFGDDVELRKRAADVARRITDTDASALRVYADELAGLLAELPGEESRTRWHMGLVVPRVAHTREQRLRVARLMLLLAEDESNVVRCSAMEGIALLAVEEVSLRGYAEEMIERFLWDGTAAMKCRARAAKRRLEKVGREARMSAATSGARMLG